MADANDSLILTILKEIRETQKENLALLHQLIEGQERHSRRFDDLGHHIGAIAFTLKGRLNPI